ncbi:MAG: hypothetical protein HY072_08640 [Deltaproteobacteria bacterium]|nr:hypothetical protein [Deltaproteobacteria bacterium]
MLRNKIIFSVLALCALMFNTSCSKNTTTDNTTPTELDGTWVSGCISGGFGIYSKRTFVTSGNSFTNTEITYSDSSCLDANKMSKFVDTGTFALGDVVSISDVIAATSSTKKFDWVVSKLVITPLRTDVASDYNTASGGAGYCSVTTWVKDQETNVTDKSCTDIKSSGTTFYDIYKLDTSATPNTLTFGNPLADPTKDRSTDAKRPSTLYTGTNVFTKQ